MNEVEVCMVPVEKIREYREMLKSGKKWQAEFVGECLEDLLIEKSIETAKNNKQDII